MKEIIGLIAKELNIPTLYIKNTIDLLEGGATVPFISRYRKEATGALDEVKIASILDRMLELKELKRRKEFIISAISAQEKLTPELQAKIEQSWDANEIEDYYLPYKPKRQTRAQVARQKGLEPLAKIIMSQDNSRPVGAEKFISDKVADAKEAVAGAKDIIAEWVNENASTRNLVRNMFARTATITTKVAKGKEAEGAKYRDLFNWQRPLNKLPGHRLLAAMRGNAEGILKLDLSPADYTVEKIQQRYVKGHGPKSELVAEAVTDAYTRLLKPSIENEFLSIAKRNADLEAIEVFATNLKGLLLASPLGGKRMIAIDPGFRTGCKTVVLDENGSLLHHTTIYPHSKADDVAYAEMQLLKLLDKYDIHTIAIGSGTAGRETRDFIVGIQPGDVDIYMVNEDGASVYSASKVAREEFADYDVTVRGAVSIGRRLMDPLSELVKIDPKSIGVGQYQHDVDQSLLKKRLDSVTESCVNLVGVNLNTAGPQLLTYVSGLGSSLAKNIVDYRAAHGAFHSRRELMEVPRLGAKAFEQSAGFLRIPESDNPLDNSAVHPERYRLVERMASDLGVSVKQLVADKALQSHIEIQKYIDENTGEDTLKDILSELAKPGRDPRTPLSQFRFDDSISTIDDLAEGMLLPGIVSNVTKFGCFVDLGIKTKGLVHISQLPVPPQHKRLSDPAQVVKVNQHVMVKVLSVDTDLSRIALSMKGVDQPN
jgi:uncharacterized protein